MLLAFQVRETQLKKERDETVRFLQSNSLGVWCNDGHDPITILNITNRLRRMGRHQAMLTLREYAKIADEQDGPLYLLVPLVFQTESDEVDGFDWFRWTFVQDAGLVYHMLPDGMGPGPCRQAEYLEWAVNHGKFTPTILEPPNNPIEITFNCCLKAEKKIQGFEGYGSGYAQWSKMHICNQLLRSLGGKADAIDIQDLYESILVNTPDSKILRDKLDDRIRWDHKRQQYVIAKDEST